MKYMLIKKHQNDVIIIYRRYVIIMNINYDKIQQSINEYGNYILTCIKNQYGNSCFTKTYT